MQLYVRSNKQTVCTVRNFLDIVLAQTNRRMWIYERYRNIVGSWRMVCFFSVSLFSLFLKLIHLNAYTFSKWYFITFRETHRRSHGCLSKKRCWFYFSFITIEAVFIRKKNFHIQFWYISSRYSFNNIPNIFIARWKYKSV